MVIVFAVLAATSIGGLIGTVVLGATGEKYGSYGEVEIPGSALIDLPAGEVIVSFRAGEHRGRGLTVPKVNFDITPPSGSPDPTVTEDLGSTVSVRGDAHRRVWFMRVAEPGTYRVTTGGEVNGVVEPRLAFGQTRSLEGPLWVFAGLAVISVDLLVAAWWFGRRRSRKATS